MQKLSVPTYDEVFDVKLENAQMIECVLKNNSFDVSKPILTSEQFEDLDDFFATPTIVKYTRIKMIYGEKFVINHIFNGSKGAMIAHEKSSESEEEMKLLIKKGEHPLLVTEEELIVYNNDESKGYAPDSALVYNKLGTAQGKESNNERGLIFELFIRNKLPKITADGVMEYARQIYHRNISPASAIKYASEINKMKTEYESSLFDGNLGDSKLVKSTVKEISHICEEKMIPRELGVKFAHRGRQIAKAFEDDYGKAIGLEIMREDVDGKTEIAVGLVERICKSLGCSTFQVSEMLMNRTIRKKS